MHNAHQSFGDLVTKLFAGCMNAQTLQPEVMFQPELWCCLDIFSNGLRCNAARDCKLLDFRMTRWRIHTNRL